MVFLKMFFVIVATGFAGALLNTGHPGYAIMIGILVTIIWFLSFKRWVKSNPFDLYRTYALNAIRVPILA